MTMDDTYWMVLGDGCAPGMMGPVSAMDEARYGAV